MNKEQERCCIGGSAPKPPGFNAFQPECVLGQVDCPAIPATKSALRFRPRIALPSAWLPTEYRNVLLGHLICGNILH